MKRIILFLALGDLTAFLTTIPKLSNFLSESWKWNESTSLRTSIAVCFIGVFCIDGIILWIASKIRNKIEETLDGSPF